MKMKINFGKKILENIKDKGEYLAVFFTVIIFLFFTVSAFRGVDLEKEEIPNYEKAAENNFDEYNKNINRISNDLKKILEKGQLDEIMIYDDLIKDNFYIQKNKNPFIKSF